MTDYELKPDDIENQENEHNYEITGTDHINAKLFKNLQDNPNLIIMTEDPIEEDDPEWA